MNDLEEAISSDPRERSAVLKAIAERNKHKASLLLKKLIRKRTYAVLFAILTLLFAIKNVDNWMDVQPIAWNGLRFFAMIFSSLAFVAALVNLIIQHKRLKQLVNAMT